MSLESKVMINKYIADLHVHTLLSPCGNIEMTPHHIIKTAHDFGISIVAVSDHNSSANVAAAMEAARHYDIWLIPSMEVECKEEAHIITLFPTLAALFKWQDIVDANMMGIINDTKRFGIQLIVDCLDNVVEEEPRFLLGPLKLSAQEVVKEVLALGGICIPAHVDRPAFSLVGQLGFVTRSQGFSAVEISTRGFDDIAAGKYKRLTDNLTVISNSDAHTIQHFVDNAKSEFYLKKRNFEELKLALSGQQGRYVLPIKNIFEQNLRSDEDEVL